MKKRLALTIIGWLISIVSLASLFAHMNFDALLSGFARARFEWLIFAAAINLIVMAVKALRWQMIMQPGMTHASLPRSRDSAPKHNAVSYMAILSATFIGNAANNVLPARGGDLLRIYLLGKWANVSKAVVASVTALDKLFDGISILMLFAIFLFGSVAIGKHGEAFPEWVRRGTIIASIAIAVSLLACYMLLFHHRRTGSSMQLGRISKTLKNLGAGMGMLTSRKLMIGTNITSLVSTLIQIITIWACQMAFGVHLSFWLTAVVFIAINLAIIIPSAPSGVGPFEAAAVLAYAWIGLKTETAFNVAVMYHAVQFFPVTIIGLVCYLRATNGFIKVPKQELS